VSFDEDAWWGDCVNTFHEEQKQLVYAPRMGLLAGQNSAHPPTYDLGGRSVIDIGGGPVSILLKCINFSFGIIIDPGKFPQWTIDRYEAHGLRYVRRKGEEMDGKQYADEAWIYNVLQHCDDPALVIEKAKASAKTIRLFEWIDIPPYDGHPHMLTQDGLEEWLGGGGFATNLHENGAVGRAFYGVFGT
jgi:hypothetical protein